MFGFCPLASGSKGNCLYVGSTKTRILVDAGISTSTIFKRLAEIEIDPKSIQAVFVTHEHSDHIKGLSLLTSKLQIPVITNAETAKGICAALGERPRFKIFTTGETFQFDDLTVHPFSVPHDTLDPVGFTIQIGLLKLGICADIGHVTSMVKKQLENCDYLYLEANHQPSMVHSSNRPHYLKQRILGKQGHLSNEDCAMLISKVMHENLKHVHLAHLSGECNTDEVALKVVQELIASHPYKVDLSIAHQDRVSKPVFFGPTDEK